jgi:hypothetical protein
VVETDGLENRYARNGIGGSNPPASAMTKRKRRHLFYSLIFLFILLGSPILGYVYGWRITFSPLNISKVGGIYIKTFPAESTIYLNNEPLKKRRSLLDSGIFINGLTPKNYRISVTAPNFNDWTRNIYVEPAFVAELKYVVLVPANNKLIHKEPVKEFWTIGNRVLIKDTENNLSLESIKILGDIVLGWTDDYSRLLTQDSIKKIYYWNDLKSTTSTNLNILMNKIGSPITNETKLIPDPKNNSNIIIYSPTAISILNTNGQYLTKIANGKNLSRPAISDSFIAWTTWNEKTGTSTLTIYDKFSNAKKEISQSISGKNTKLEYASNGTLGILQSNAILYIKRIDQDIVEKVADDSRDFTFDEDGSMLASLENKSIEIFPLSKDPELKYARFNPPNVSEIKNLKWYYDKRHLLLDYDNRVTFLDTEDNSLENLQKIADTKLYRYDPKSNRFYFLANDLIYSLEFAK